MPAKKRSKPGLKRITIVDLDPEMVHIARYYRVLQKINHNSFADPRVTIVIADALTWLQNCDQKFDAIYIDFPDPNTYDLAKLYSLEFYSLVRHCVSKNGFVAADIPSGEYYWDEYYSTFYAAGFEQIKPFDNLLEIENEGILELEKEYSGQDVTAQMDENIILRQEFKKLVTEIIEGLEHRFIFLQTKKQAIKTHFKDYGIPLYVFNETRFNLTSKVKFDDTFKPGRVNSIYRPTLPGFDFFSVNYPY